MNLEDVIGAWCSHSQHLAEDGDRIYRVWGTNGGVLKTICMYCIVVEWNRADQVDFMQRLAEYFGDEPA